MCEHDDESSIGESRISIKGNKHNNDESDERDRKSPDNIDI